MWGVVQEGGEGEGLSCDGEWGWGSQGVDGGGGICKGEGGGVRDQTQNLWFRRPTPYSLGHKIFIVRFLIY